MPSTLKILLIATLAAAGLAPALAPTAQGRVAAVFPPWWAPARTLLAASAGGAVLQLGALPFIAIVAPATARSPASLRGHGAWLLLNADRLGGCAPTPKNIRNG